MPSDEDAVVLSFHTASLRASDLHVSAPCARLLLPLRPR